MVRSQLYYFEEDGVLAFSMLQYL